MFGTVMLLSPFPLLQGLGYVRLPAEHSDGEFLTGKQTKDCYLLRRPRYENRAGGEHKLPERGICLNS